MRTGIAGSRRLVAVGALLAVLAAACSSGGDGPRDRATGPSTTAVASAPGDPAVKAAPAGTGDPGGGATAGGSGGDSGGGTSGGPDTTRGTAPSAPQPSVIAVGSSRVGEVAPALLRPGRGDQVVIEVRAQSGAGPEGATIDHLVRVVAGASGKRVSVDGTDALPGGAHAWTPQEIVSAAAAAAQAESGRAQVVLRLLFLRGTFQGDTGVLGVAVAGDVAAVFSDQVDSAAGVLVAPAVVEDAVTMHEVGHLLGLVDLLLGSGRGDPAHPGHSRNRRSVMYWQVDSGLITQLLDGGIPRDLDDDDRAELAQIRAG
jgi:hypothetical protein